MLTKLFGLLRELVRKIDEAGYTSVPQWKPWRDF